MIKFKKIKIDGNPEIINQSTWYYIQKGKKYIEVIHECRDFLNRYEHTITIRIPIEPLHFLIHQHKKG